MVSDNDVRFDGRVVIVTGAGGGLGRCYALLFAQRGAKVVVNDLGGDQKGGGKSSRPADIVVEEIRAKGGVAVSNYDSVEEGQKVVQTALDNFGRVDVVVNNAGILRDRSFARISDADWDLIQRVHLRGSFQVSRAAWPHMRKQKYGRIIMTASPAAIYGNFGQANYSAAKFGLLGLSNTLAVEGRKDNILVNTIAPTAESRLTADLLSPDMLAVLKPDYIAPLVMWLSHDDCKETGGLFELGAGWIGKLRWQKSEGAVLARNGSTMSPEAVRDNWSQIVDFSSPCYDSDIQEALKSILAKVFSPPEGGVKIEKTIDDTTENCFDVSKAIGVTLPDMPYSYAEKDAILYALGVGVSTSQPDHLKFLFELSDAFAILPTFLVLPVVGFALQTQVPGIRVDPTQILHGEQYLELLRPLPTCGRLICRGSVADVLDKGSGAVLLFNVDVFTEAGEKLAFGQVTTFVQKAGGFGGQRSSAKAVMPVDPPQRTADASTREKISIDQAALYRLSGDRNPLHIDPNFAAFGGFSKPILHGLCTFGFAARHVLQKYCDNDVTKFKAIKVRFSKPVYPGQTIETSMWKEGQRVHFTCKVVETGEVCLSGGYVDITGGHVDQVVKPIQTLLSDSIFELMEERLRLKLTQTKKINNIILYKITKNGAVVSLWTIDMTKGSVAVYRGEPKGTSAGCTIVISDGDLVALVTGKLNGQQAFLSGKLKVTGNVMIAQSIGQILADKSSL